MSADYWERCPFCAKKTLDAIANLNGILKLEYERMSAKNYDEFKTKTQKEIDKLKETMEDSVCFYNSLGFHEESGEYRFIISGQCQKCKFIWEQKGRIVAQPDKVR